MRWDFIFGILLMVFASAIANSVLQYSDNEESAAENQNVYKYNDGESSASKITLENDIEFDSFDSPKSTDDETKSEESSDESSKPGVSQPSVFGRILSSLISVPRSLFQAIGTFFASAPLTRLRDEVKNLNISYPKN